MMGTLKRQAGHWFCSWQMLCQRSQPRPNWLMVWYLLKAKIVSKGSTPSQQEQEHFGRWEEPVWMERCTSQSYSRCLLVSDQPILVLLFLYLQTLCNPSQQRVTCPPLHAILPLLMSLGEIPQAVPGSVLRNRGHCLHSPVERGKAAGMPARRGCL